MKVLLVTNALGGGAGRACTRLFEALRLNGIDVKLLHLEGQGSGYRVFLSEYSRSFLTADNLIPASGHETHAHGRLPSQLPDAGFYS